MFTFNTEVFGETIQITLNNTLTGESVGIIPNGATLNSLCLKKNNVLYDLIDGSSTYDDYIANGLRVYKGIFLFPFPNRLSKSKFNFENNDYSFDSTPNEPNDNALHGYFKDVKFDIKRFESFADKAELELFYFESGKNSSYPFSSEILILYTLSEGSLIIKTTIINHDIKNAPIAFGWHPYFKTSSLIDECMLHFSDIEEIEVDKNMIPTGKMLPSTTFVSKSKVNDIKFDTGFKLINQKSKSFFSVFDSKISLHLDIWLDSNYGFIQVYIPPDRKTIALEAMTAPADSFNNKIGLQVLKPSQSTEAVWGIELK